MKYLRIGYIKKPHGLKGELKALPLTDCFERFRQVSQIFLLLGARYDKYVEFTVTGVKITPNGVILKIKGIDDCNDAENFRNVSVFIDREQGLALEDGEYYTQDLIGCEVYHDDTCCGEVIDVRNYGASDIFVISSSLASSKGQEVFYPFLNNFIDFVDVNKKIIKINNIEGFFN